MSTINNEEEYSSKKTTIPDKLDESWIGKSLRFTRNRGIWKKGEYFTIEKVDNYGIYPANCVNKLVMNSKNDGISLSECLELVENEDTDNPYGLKVGDRVIKDGVSSKFEYGVIKEIPSNKNCAITWYNKYNEPIDIGRHGLKTLRPYQEKNQSNINQKQNQNERINSKENSQNISVQPITAEISTGKRCSGATVQGRRVRTTVEIGHLSNKSVSV